MGYTVAPHLCVYRAGVVGSGAVGVREKCRRKVHAVILDCETVCDVFTIRR